MLRGGSNTSAVKAEAGFRYSTLFPSLQPNFALESCLSLKFARCILVASAKAEENQPNNFQVTGY